MHEKKDVVLLRPQRAVPGGIRVGAWVHRVHLFPLSTCQTLQHVVLRSAYCVLLVSDARSTLSDDLNMQKHHTEKLKAKGMYCEVG